jgi:predicted small lipoprotein YifL
MVASVSRSLPLTLFSERPFIRVAMVGALVASLGLAACGRKGPLDPPPSASVTDAPAEQPKQSSLNPIAMQPIGSASQGGGNMLETPPGPKKRIFLDGLLN